MSCSNRPVLSPHPYSVRSGVSVPAQMCLCILSQSHTLPYTPSEPNISFFPASGPEPCYAAAARPLACLPACSRTGRSGRSRHHRYLSLKFSRTPARETVGALSDKVRGDFCKSPWWKKVKTVTTCFSEVIIMRINGGLGGGGCATPP